MLFIFFTVESFSLDEVRAMENVEIQQCAARIFFKSNEFNFLTRKCNASKF